LLLSREVLARQRLEPFLDLPARSLGVGELRAERVVISAEPAKARLLLLEFPTRGCKLAPERTLDLPLFLEALTELTCTLQSRGELVAFVERHGEERWLGRTSVAGAVSAHPVGIRAPLAWPASLAGNGHGAIVTKRNETCTRSGEKM
jgi:hypothetical protein